MGGPRTAAMLGWAAAGVWAMVLLVGCPNASNDPTDVRNGFVKERREAELEAKVQTLDAKLNEARGDLARSQSRGDGFQAELTAERNFRAQEKQQYDLAVRLNADMKKQIEEYRDQKQKDDGEIAVLRKDVVQTQKMLDERKDELVQLREQVKKLTAEIDALRRQAQR